MKAKNSGDRKFDKVMHEWGAGKLHSASKHGPLVTDQKQALAIAFSEKRKHERAGNTEYEPHHSVPTLLSSDPVDDTLDGLNKNVLANDTRYTVVPGTDRSQVREIMVHHGGKLDESKY